MEDPEHVFSNGLHLANLAVSSNILIDSWNAISEPRRDKPGTIIKHHPDYNIIAFVGSPRSDLEKTGLVPVSEISDFQLLRSDTHPSFWINEAAFSLFNTLREEFLQRQEEVKTSFKPDASGSSPKKRKKADHIPHIITGHCLNGSIASLFTLSLLKMLHQTEYKLPLCITFGSPLLGDTTFQQAVSCNLTWNSCYLHVVQKGDCVPRLLPTTGQSPYKPFGTFLLCSESGYACFQAPESIAELLKYESPRVVAGNLASQTFDYRNAVERSEKLLLHRNVSSFLGNETFFTIKADSYKVGIAAQVIAAGFWQRQQQNEAIHAHVENIAKHERNVIKRQREVFDPAKELKEMKVCLGSLEWYMDICRANGHGPGYYDSFKNAQERRDNGVDKYKTYLTEYWEQVVKDAEEKPQEVGAPLRNRWLFAGTNYRRIVEPLDIAEYYRRGRKDYLTRRRSNHYKLLEKWLKDYQDSERAGKTKETKDGRSVVTVTEDSCFWAHVEEAIRSCRLLDRASSEQEKLTKFEEYVMDLIGEKKVSSDIFLEKSNYMQWWKEYQDKVAHQSPLMDYMKAGRYKGYGKGSQFNSNGSPADTSPGPTTSGDPHR